ncbi:MAG: hypothetical protein Q8Q32_01060 [bacterium]|nr:hypothetical protein [bacterium]
MNKKILIGAVAAVIILAGGLILSQKDKEKANEIVNAPSSLPLGFTVTPTGGGEFGIGEEVMAGFTMKYTGNNEKKGQENSTFSVHEATAFPTGGGVLSPEGKNELALNEIAQLDETISYELKGYVCEKEGSDSIAINHIEMTYDIDGEPQTSSENGKDKFWGQTLIPIKCVVKMIQIDPVNPVMQAGTSPWGELERQRAEGKLPN